MTNRIRYLKPDFFLDEDVANLPPLIRLFYAGMWTHADREGRLEDRPQRLKVEVMPYEEGFSVEDALALLAKPKANSGRPFVVRYEVNGQKYIQILSWAQHQRPHPNEKASAIPAVPRETLALYDKGQTRVPHKKDKGPSLEHGDGDCDGDCDGDGECEGKGEIDPPAPIQGSGRASEGSARPSLTLTISDDTIKKLMEIKTREEVIEILKKGGYPVPSFLQGQALDPDAAPRTGSPSVLPGKPGDCQDSRRPGTENQGEKLEGR